MSREQSVGELRASIQKSIRRNWVMFWFCLAQTVIGAFWVLLSEGSGGWGWFIVGFILMFLYRGMVIFNTLTLKKLEGLPDDA